MSTPGRRKALRALAARKRSNRARLARGQNPVINNAKGQPKSVSKATFRKRTGASTSKTDAKRRQRAAKRK